MAKKNKLSTPDWILEGYDSEAKYNEAKGKTKQKKGETFKVRKCPDCNSDTVEVVVGEEAKGLWKCKECGWKGSNVKKEELTEDEFMKYLDEKGEGVA